ncbi:uncharacterized protein LOC122533053 isoform X2 [Frieseomelitta varia]|uniref:uncharacterized protein LOC122533053 isoform X2 n=1 Tax=Frieseomelitta varia TaxID=561572 RepID=UPI001CB6AF4D|nr:uncharacterized protein LOC122533053 isoform X2 [Frieseomelitta varia]
MVNGYKFKITQKCKHFLKTFNGNCYLRKIDPNYVIIIMSQFPITNITNETFSKLMYHDRNKTRSNLPFQIALYVNLWLFPIWLLISIVNLDAKYNNLSNIYKLLAVATFLVLSIFESLKLYLGYLGNLTGKMENNLSTKQAEHGTESKRINESISQCQDLTTATNSAYPCMHYPSFSEVCLE